MNVLTSTKRFYHCLIIGLTLILLAACSSQRLPKDTWSDLFSELNHNSAYFIKKADEGNEQQNLTYQFLSVQALISEKEFTLANSIIEYLQSQQLTATQKSALNLLLADNFYLQNQPNKAMIVLNNTNSDSLSKIGFIHYLKLLSQLQIGNEAHLDAANTLFLLTPQLQTDEEKQQYNDLLFSQLISLPIEFVNQQQALLNPKKIAITEPLAILNPEEIDIPIEPLNINQAITETQPPIVATLKGGWYSLAYLYLRYQLRPNQLIRSLDEWKAKNSTHAAFYFMPSLLTGLSTLSPYQPENIAVLIPLSGRFKQQGEVIQYGLLHAYYERFSKQEADSPKVKLNFYDTQSQNMEEIVNQFAEQHIDFVIGPLLKSKVEEFLPLAEKTPTLALNIFPEKLLKEDEEKQDAQIAWHYAFPLSPEEEAKQAARMIFYKGHKKPLLLAPDSSYGKRITQAFDEEWATLDITDETPIEAYFFNEKSQLASFIGDVLQTEKSKRRIDQMKMITKLPLETKLRSRRDIDAIYIISKRDELLMLKAFISVSISPFARTIPLYASSRSHLDDRQSKELSRLTFSDSPFLLDKNNKTLKEVQKALPNQSFSALRLFALGFDSYQLIEQLIQMQNNEDYTYKGLIGELSLDANNTVLAKLNWAKYYRGKTIEITTPISAE